MRIKTKFKFLIFIFFLLFALFSFLTFYFLSQIQKKVIEIQEKEREILTIEKREEAIREFKRNSEKLEKLSEIILKEKEPLPFAQFLEEISKESGTVVEISFKKEPKQPFPFCQINFEGKFPFVFQFLEKLEKSQFLLNFQRLDLSSDKEGIKGSILIEVFAK